MKDLEERIYKKVDLQVIDGECEEIEERIVRETLLTVNVNGELFISSMVLAGMEKEYAAGYLFSQGFISSSSEISSISFDKDRVDVVLYTRLATAERGPVGSDLRVFREDIFACVRAVLESSVFEETEAVHSAGLFMEGTHALAVTEDIGRQHAFDKVIGAGLLSGIDFSRVVAASTGRVPVEMVTRCRNASIPVIATKGVPTNRAIKLAGESNVTIAGLVRGDTMFVYSHPERIV